MERESGVSVAGVSTDAGIYCPLVQLCSKRAQFDKARPWCHVASRGGAF